MKSKPEESTGRSLWRPWFYLTREERGLVLAILILALIGLTARYIHLQRQQPDPVTPAETRDR